MEVSQAPVCARTDGKMGRAEHFSACSHGLLSVLPIAYGRTCVYRITECLPLLPYQLSASILYQALELGVFQASITVQVCQAQHDGNILM